MAYEHNGQIVLDDNEDEIIRALRLLEWYCLEKRGIASDKCSSCILSYLMSDGEDCPFQEQEPPADWEIGEILFNSGVTIKYKDGHLYKF